MDQRFLGLISFSAAQEEERQAFASVLNARSCGVILGFECEPVITFGVRAGSGDLLRGRPELEALGFQVCTVQRGGQATIHNPGQLVIFPVMSVRDAGAKAWVERLAEVTRACLSEFGVASEWRAEAPGLHTARGKIMACGVRIRQGISTHGIAINVSNRLSDFALIRACGIAGASIDRLGEGIPLVAVFNVWCRKFHEATS